MRDTQRERGEREERERERQRQREKQAPCREPNVGLDALSPRSHPGLKASTKPLSHPGIPFTDLFGSGQGMNQRCVQNWGECFLGSLWPSALPDAIACLRPDGCCLFVSPGTYSCSGHWRPFYQLRCTQNISHGELHRENSIHIPGHYVRCVTEVVFLPGSEWLWGLTLLLHLISQPFNEAGDYLH